MLNHRLLTISVRRLASTDAASVLKDKKHGSLHWTYERIGSAALIPVLGYALCAGASPINDAALGLLLPIHCHIGMGSIITDYVHKRKFPMLSIAATWGMRMATVGVLYACYKLNTKDVGVTETIRRVWTSQRIKSE